MTRRILVLLVVVLAVAIAADLVLRSLDVEIYRRIAERELSRAFARKVEITGGLNLELFPKVQLEAHGLTVANAPGRPSDHMLTVGSVGLGLRIFPLLRGSLEIDKIDFHDVELRLESDADGQIDFKPDVDAVTDETGDEPFDLQVRSTTFNRLRVFHLHGGTGALTTVHIEQLQLREPGDGRPVQMRASGEWDGGPFEVSGHIGPLGELFQPTGPFDFELRGQVLHSRVSARGSVGDPDTLRDLDVVVEALVPDLWALDPQPGRKLEPLGPVRVSARLSDANGVLGMRELDLEALGDAPLLAKLSGSIERLADVQGVQLDFEFGLPDVRFLESVLERPLPPGVTASGSGQVHDRDGTLGVRGTLNLEAAEGTARVEATGEVGDVRELSEIDLVLEVYARDLAVAGQLLERGAWPEFGPVTATGRVLGSRGALRLEKLRGRIEHEGQLSAEVTGSIDDLLELRGVRLDAKLDAEDPAVLHQFSPRPLPDLGRLEASGVLTDSDGTLGLERFHLVAAHGPDFNVALRGTIEDLRELGDLEFHADVRARSLDVLGALAQVDLPELGPVEFSGAVQGSREQLRSRGSFTLATTTGNGGWLARFPSDQRPSLEADLELGHLNAGELLAADWRAPADPPPADPGWRRRELPFDDLRHFDADVSIHAARVSGAADFHGEAASIEIDLEDGRLSLHKLALLFEGGRVAGDLRVDASTPVPRVQLNLDADNVDLRRMPNEVVPEGRLDGRVRLSASGQTPDALIRSLSGSSAFAIRDWLAGSQYARKVLREMTLTFVPGFRGRPEETRFGCLAADFEIENGLADVVTLVLSSPRVRLNGTGSIDLRNETLDLDLVPTVREPGLIMAAARVRVGGTLRSPQFRPVTRSLATSAVRSVLRSATRPDRIFRRPMRLGAGHADTDAECPDLFATPPTNPEQ